MDRERDQLSFPENTLFYRLDGVLFAVLSDERWVGVDDKDMLINLSIPYAEELARMVDLWELIDECEFRTALAAGWSLPSDASPRIKETKRKRPRLRR